MWITLISYKIFKKINIASLCSDSIKNPLSWLQISVNTSFQGKK